MQSKEFVGITGVAKDTPNGGKITVSFGNIITECEQKLQAIAFQIKDANGDIVTEFALQPETFGVLLDAIKELYDESF
jgi:hypothetical protein